MATWISLSPLRHNMEPLEFLSIPIPSSHQSHANSVNERLEAMMNTIDWEALASIACGACGYKSATWRDQLCGGYNIVRFLHLGEDPNSTEIVARVPLYPTNGLTDSGVEALKNRISSEVASMEYVASHTRVPVPRVIGYSSEKDGGGVGCPYILMTKVEGTPLSSFWNEMEDEQREVILKQVIDIILQLSTLRFDKIGVLMKEGGDDGPAWRILPISTIMDADDLRGSGAFSKRTYTSAFDYWIEVANAYLQRIDNELFGYALKPHDYAMGWFLRSLVPSFYNPSLDTKGFPLCPGDFHSQNIMVADVDTPNPRITAVIDWEFTTTEPTSSFTQYPLFIVDHPLWEDDHPLRERNVQDQAKFNSFIREAERKFDPEGEQGLADAFENCQGVYLLQQCLQHPETSTSLLDQLFQYVYGTEGNGGDESDEEDFSDFLGDYYHALMAGILKKETEQFDTEVHVRIEAVELLGEELVPPKLTRSEFKVIALQNIDKFEEGGEVRVWLSGYGAQ